MNNYGREYNRKLTTPQKAVEKIKNEVLFFSSGEPQFDDITLVILRVTGGGE